MGASQVKLFTLSTGQSAVVASGPALLTSLVLAEVTGVAPAVIDVTGKSCATTYMQFMVPAGQTVVWHGDPLAFGAGIGLVNENGDAAVTAAWR
jgi:hypothetical protein